MLLPDLLTLLRDYAPEDHALANDPVGLLIDPAYEEIKRVLVCLDATQYVSAQAAELACQLVIAHHPLIYHPLPRLSQSDPVAASAVALVRCGAGLYAMHTNWDAADGGINDTLARRLGLTDVKPLGTRGEASLARIGRLSQPISAPEMPALIARVLGNIPTSAVRTPRVFASERMIETIAVCGGAGSSLSVLALELGAQAFVTADVRHHEFVEAASRGLLLIDAGHEATEAPGMLALAERLAGDTRGLLDVHYTPNWSS